MSEQGIIYVLRSCPFCGNDELDEAIYDVNEGVCHEPWYVVHCPQCEVRTVGARDLKDAVAIWNQRCP